jgi:hypothetical protein
MTPRRAKLVDNTAVDNTSTDSDSATKRSLEMAKRQAAWERRREARSKLDKRLFGWLGEWTDGSSNCYSNGYPAFGGACPSASSPYIRSSVPSPPFYNLTNSRVPVSIQLKVHTSPHGSVQP